MENLRNRIDVKLINNEKDYLKYTSKTSYMSGKIFDNSLVAIRKSKLALKLNKFAYIGISILELSKILMYEFHYDYVKNKNDKTQSSYSQRLIVQYMKLKLKVSIRILAVIKKCLISVTKSKHYHDSNKLDLGKMKDETGGVAIKEYVGLKPKI